MYHSYKRPKRNQWAGSLKGKEREREGEVWRARTSNRRDFPLPGTRRAHMHPWVTLFASWNLLLLPRWFPPLPSSLTQITLQSTLARFSPLSTSRFLCHRLLNLCLMWVIVVSWSRWHALTHRTHTCCRIGVIIGLLITLTVTHMYIVKQTPPPRKLSLFLSHCLSLFGFCLTLTLITQTDGVYRLSERSHLRKQF